MESRNKQTKKEWCATMWALKKTANTIGSRERERKRWENGAKPIVKEKKERRVRLLHTVQHARQNTTSLSTTAPTLDWYYCYETVRQTSMRRKTILHLITKPLRNDHLQVQGNGISAPQTISVNISNNINIYSNTPHAQLWSIIVNQVKEWI